MRLLAYRNFLSISFLVAVDGMIICFFSMYAYNVVGAFILAVFIDSSLNANVSVLELYHLFPSPSFSAYTLKLSSGK